MLCKKYYDVRKQFKDGDIVLYHGTDFVSRIISNLDNAFYTHCGVVKWIGTRIFTINIGKHGIEFVPLSRIMSAHNQFCVLRIKNRDAILVDLCVDSLFDIIDKKIVNYKYSLLKNVFYKHILNKKILTITAVDLCEHLINVLEVDCYKNCNLTTPQDLIRNLNEDDVEVIYDLNLN